MSGMSRRRYRMQLVADAGAGRFHALLCVEDTWTGDDRMFVEGSLTWRDLPLPLMAKDTDEHGSYGADTRSILIGNFDRIEKQGLEVHGWGSYITDPDEEAADLIRRVNLGELRGISADIDDVEYEVLFPVDSEPDAGEELGEAIDDFDDPADEMPRETDEDGQEYIVWQEKQPRLRVTEGRVMGATVVPFPALQECFIEGDDAESSTDNEAAPMELAASAARTMAHHGVTGMILSVDDDDAPARTEVTAAASGHFNFPVLPPSEFFTVPEPDGPMALTLLDNGQIMGHIATWGECHTGITGECVEPPTSPSGYARFHVGELTCDDGSKVAVGRLTFNTGHAGRGWDAAKTIAHYDNTGTQGAYIVAKDGAHGIWVCGAAKAGLTDGQVQEMMAAPPSGDWRRFGQHLELVGVLAVNVPGFNTPRGALVRKEDGLVASLIVFDAAPMKQRAELTAETRRLMASIDRTAADARARVVARIHERVAAARPKEAI